MFHLHDRTRRRICRAVFLLACVAPTGLVLLWAAARQWPGHVEAEARALGRQLGLQATLAGVQYLAPGRMLYEGLQLADPETGQTLLCCRSVELAWSTSADTHGTRRPRAALSAVQPEIAAAGLDRLAELLQRAMQQPPDAGAADVHLTAGNVTILTVGNSQTLADFQASIESLASGVRAQAAFRLAGSDAAEPVRIRLLRNRQTTPPANAFELDTGVSALPCAMLAMLAPELACLGPRSRFRGTFWANESSRGGEADAWDGKLSGQLFDVDLGKLVSEQFPHKLSGAAQLTIPSAHFRQGRLEEASGLVSAGPGLIGRSLLEAAAAYLKLWQRPLADTPGDLVPYEQLMLAVVIDSGGLRLQGRCLTGGPGTILADRNGRLLGEPLSQPQPVVALLQMLVPASEVQVPATQQTDWFMRRLPLPTIVPSRGTEIALPHARLRLSAQPPNR